MNAPLTHAEIIAIARKHPPLWCNGLSMGRCSQLEEAAVAFAENLLQSAAQKKAFTEGHAANEQTGADAVGNDIAVSERHARIEIRQVGSHGFGGDNTVSVDPGHVLDLVRALLSANAKAIATEEGQAVRPLSEIIGEPSRKLVAGRALYGVRHPVSQRVNGWFSYKPHAQDVLKFLREEFPNEDFEFLELDKDEAWTLTDDKVLKPMDSHLWAYRGAINKTATEAQPQFVLQWQSGSNSVAVLPLDAVLEINVALRKRGGKTTWIPVFIGTRDACITACDQFGEDRHDR